MVAGKIAFVTGAGSGIGREVCKILAKEGAIVIAADRNLPSAQETVESLNDINQHMAVHLEVTSITSIKEAFENVKIKYSKPPTIIVNSAGITRDRFILNLSEETFDQVIDVNLKGIFLIMKVAVAQMVEAKTAEGASIINVSSIHGNTGNRGQANYSAAKAGVIALTKTAAYEFGQYGIRVNSVLPGFIETPMTKTVPDKVRQNYLNRIPLQRMGNPEEVAEVIVFLASDKSSYINAAPIPITGGLQ